MGKLRIGMTRVVACLCMLFVLCGMLYPSRAATTYTCDDWISSLDKVAENLEKDHFYYNVNGGKGTYAKTKAKRRTTNCAVYVSWALQELGILKKGQVFWIDKGGAIRGKNKTCITKNSRVRILHPNKKAAKAGLKKGDICGWATHIHTAVYAGKDSKGNLLWYSAGRDGAVKKNGKWYFKASKTKAKTRAKRYNGKISTVIRIKNLKKTSEKSKVTAINDGTQNENDANADIGTDAANATEVATIDQEDAELEADIDANAMTDEDDVLIASLEPEEMLDNVVDNGTEEAFNKEENSDSETEPLAASEKTTVTRNENEIVTDQATIETNNSGVSSEEIVDDTSNSEITTETSNEMLAEESPDDITTDSVQPDSSGEETAMTSKEGSDENEGVAIAESDSTTNSSATTPETGDESIWYALIFISFSGFLLLVLAHHRKSEWM